jgi:C4-dicarboxylate transporter DctM subunit
LSPEMIGLIGIIILIVLMIFFKVWVGFAMALVGFVGYMVFEGWDMAVFMSGMEPYTSVAAYTLSCIPLFILMGSVVAGTGISTDIYVAARQWIGFVRGGIAMATVAACGLFAAITGSSMATAVTMGKAAYPEMVKYEYDDKMAAGSIAAGGTIGILIPPSIAFITYGILTETPIGQLFIAGIIPGILEVVFYILTIYIICLIKPHYGPPGPKTTFKEKIISLPSVLPVVILFLVVIGGIYGGIFTPTEAGAIGAFGAIVIGLVQRRLKWGSFVFSLRETAKNTAMIILMIVSANIFSRFITLSGLPAALSEFVTGLDAPPFVILLGIIVVYLICGCFLDIMAALILTIPIIFPTVMALGFNPIWYGVIMVRMIEIGMITPPMGMNIFVLSKTIEFPIKKLYSGIVPFVISDLVHVSMLIAFPAISLYLVNLM